MAERLPDLEPTPCPNCKRAGMMIEGPLEWCPRCAYETPRSRRVPDNMAARLADRVSDAP